MEAAIATTAPTVNAVILPVVSVQPNIRKITDVPNKAAMVMPLVGFEVTPTIPTIREETVTKKNAKNTIKIEAVSLISTESKFAKT